MVFNDNNKRAMKGFLLNSFIDFKKTALIGVLITIGIFLLNFVLFTVTNIASAGNNTNSNANILNSGFITMVITFCIAIFVTTNKNEFGRKFVFPLNRNIYAIGNFIFIVVGSYTLMIIIGTLELLEVTIAYIYRAIFNDFYFINTITANSFLIGFVISLTYMIFIVSFVYLLSMLFHKYTLATSIIVPLTVAAITISYDIRMVFIDMYIFIFNEPSLPILCIKLWTLIIVFHLLAYIPLKRMEVIR